MSDIILEMKNITKLFPGVRALDDVNFDLRKAEILSIVGENGAGKSTLMKILSGAYGRSEYSGQILLDGQQQIFNNPADSEKCGIRMIYQETSAIPDMNIAENIFIGKYYLNRIGSIDWPRVYSETQKVLQRVGLDVNPKENMRSLSISQQQLVAIAKAVRTNPRILVLDEPTSTLTQSESDYLFKILNELVCNGISCVYISHKLDEVFKISDRIVVMRDGRTVACFKRGEFVREDVVTSMVGRKIEDMYAKDKSVPMGGEVLRVENFCVRHPYNPNKNIVEDINFSLQKGEILGLAGLVGSGRSELVNAIFGAHNLKWKGDVYVEGEKALIQNPKDALRYGMALATEDRKKDGLVLIETIRENISLASLGKISSRGHIYKKQEQERVKKHFSELRIKAPGIDTIAVQLSGGNQQKVVLAKWLNTDLKILILDEPTRGIDVGAKVEIYNIMCRLARSGVGIIMISSELPELLAMCDRFLVLSGGCIKAEIPKSEANEINIMMAAA